MDWGGFESACSIASINLALTGQLTDEIPRCMSALLGSWIIRIQDAMPDSMRNSREWRELLPYAAGAGRAREDERLVIILDWFIERMPLGYKVACAYGLGELWKKAQEKRDEKSFYTLSRKAKELYGRNYVESGLSLREFHQKKVARVLDEIDRMSRAVITVRKGFYKQGDDIGYATLCMVNMLRHNGRAIEDNEKIWTMMNPVELLAKLVK
jgi:hypothetical protein